MYILMYVCFTKVRMVSVSSRQSRGLRSVIVVDKVVVGYKLSLRF
jgi:hypothetical protein